MIIIGSFTIIFSCGMSYYSINKYKQDLFVSMESQIKDERPQETTEEKDKTIDTVEKRDDNIPVFNMNICVVAVDEENNVTIQTNDLDLTEEKIKSLVEKVQKENKKEGTLFDEDLLFCTNRTQGNLKIAFVEQKYLTDKVCSVCITAFVTSLLFLTIIFFISLWVSNLVVKPVEKSLDEQKRFIADASHELKTPLAVISANTKIIEKTANSKQKEWIESTNDEIKYMSKIIGEMLTLAQTENITAINKTKVDLTKLATSVCLQFEPIAFEKNIEMEQIIENDVFVNFDEKMLRQLVMILLDNAIKHEESGGKVVLCIEKKSNLTTLKVTNLKTLIPKEKITHLFERFYKVDESRTSEGFGLGLSIAKNIVDLNGCTIFVSSNEQNGTSFDIKIPN